MGIQGGNGDARLSMTQLAKDALQMLDVAQNTVTRDLADDMLEGDMLGHSDCPDRDRPRPR